MITPTRRGLITGLISLVAAPAIVRAGSLMPISVQRFPILLVDPGAWQWIRLWAGDEGADVALSDMDRALSAWKLRGQFWLGESAARSALEAHHLDR